MNVEDIGIDEVVRSFEILGLKPTLNAKEIRKAYWQKARTTHPDAGILDRETAHEQFIRLKQAVDRLDRGLQDSNLKHLLEQEIQSRRRPGQPSQPHGNTPFTPGGNASAPYSTGTTPGTGQSWPASSSAPGQGPFTSARPSAEPRQGHARQAADHTTFTQSAGPSASAYTSTSPGPGEPRPTSSYPKATRTEHDAFESEWEDFISIHLSYYEFLARSPNLLLIALSIIFSSLIVSVLVVVVLFLSMVLFTIAVTLVVAAISAHIAIPVLGWIALGFTLFGICKLITGSIRNINEIFNFAAGDTLSRFCQTGFPRIAALMTFVVTNAAFLLLMQYVTANYYLYALIGLFNVGYVVVLERISTDLARIGRIFRQTRKRARRAAGRGSFQGPRTLAWTACGLALVCTIVLISVASLTRSEEPGKGDGGNRPDPAHDSANIAPAEPPESGRNARPSESPAPNRTEGPESSSPGPSAGNRPQRPLPGPDTATSPEFPAGSPKTGLFTVESLNRFADECMQAMSAARLEKIPSFYSEHVDFFDRGVVSPGYIVEERRRFSQYWTETTYIRKGSVRILKETSPRERDIGFECYFAVKNPVKRLKIYGYVWITLTLRAEQGALRITTQREKMLERRKEEY